jgi:hypothetical protein
LLGVPTVVEPSRLVGQRISKEVSIVGVNLIRFALLRFVGSRQYISWGGLGVCIKEVISKFRASSEGEQGDILAQISITKADLVKPISISAIYM